MAVRVVLEVAPKRTFASAIDWPGWSRGGKTEEEALDALLAYAPRYAAVARRARIAFTPPATRRGLEVVERVKGDGGTEFGVPGKAAGAEKGAVSTRDLKRMIAILEACWSILDSSAKKAEGVELTKGPRGGGRELPRIMEHVREAEVAYLGQLGSRAPASADEDQARPMAKLRRAFTETLTALASGAPLADPRRTKKPWSPRYGVRRAAWHVLDHAWEIQDRSS
jgi:hypothetical protein